MSQVGELETLIILAVLHLGNAAYGVSIRDEWGSGAWAKRSTCPETVIRSG